VEVAPELPRAVALDHDPSNLGVSLQEDLVGSSVGVQDDLSIDLDASVEPELRPFRPEDRRTFLTMESSVAPMNDRTGDDEDLSTGHPVQPGSHRALRRWEGRQRGQGKLPLVWLPVQAPWLNRVERFFRDLQREVLDNSDFGGVRELSRAICRYVE